MILHGITLKFKRDELMKLTTQIYSTVMKVEIRMSEQLLTTLRSPCLFPLMVSLKLLELGRQIGISLLFPKLLPFITVMPSNVKVKQFDSRLILTKFIIR